MPFIHPESFPQQATAFYVLRGVTPHVGVSFIAHKFANILTNQGKKTLIFDALLGLKNYPLKNTNQQMIPQVLNGLQPLTDLIIHDNQIDVITGIATANLNATSLLNQKRIKDELVQLSTNYQAVLIDYPASILSPVFQEFENQIWITPPDQNILLKTLRVADAFPNPQLILNQVKNDEQRNSAYLFIKSLLPKCQIIEFFE